MNKWPISRISDDCSGRTIGALTMVSNPGYLKGNSDGITPPSGWTLLMTLTLALYRRPCAVQARHQQKESRQIGRFASAKGIPVGLGPGRTRRPTTRAA